MVQILMNYVVIDSIYYFIVKININLIHRKPKKITFVVVKIFK